jgi:hypothetical protein
MTTPAEKCAAAKRILTGKKFAGLLSCDANAVRKGAAVDPTCVATVTTTFMTAWSKAEQKGGCSTTNDAMTLENVVDAVRASLDSALIVTGPPSTCTAAKFLTTGKKGTCKLQCSARAARKGLPLSAPTIAACLTTCSTRFATAFAKAEAKKKGACHTTGDAAEIETAIDTALVTVATDALILCPAGQIGCAGTCVDPATDAANCNGCGNVCRPNEACSAGSCICAAPFTLCGTRCDVRPCDCVDLQTDPENCHTCGNVCPASCAGGACCLPDGSQGCQGPQDCCSGHCDTTTNTCGCVPTGDAGCFSLHNDCCQGVCLQKGSITTPGTCLNPIVEIICNCCVDSQTCSAVCVDNLLTQCQEFGSVICQNVCSDAGFAFSGGGIECCAPGQCNRLTDQCPVPLE